MTFLGQNGSCKKSSAMSRGGALAAVLIAASLSGQSALANETAYNPHPADGDIVLPMPGNYKMVFRKVLVPGNGFWGRSERIMVLGDEDTTAFSPKRTIRIGANFRNRDRSWYMAIGKYEVTIGQYAMVMGLGNLEAGLKVLRSKIGDKRLIKRLTSDHRFIEKTLALPIRSVTFYDHQEFIARYNEWCFGNAECNEAVWRSMNARGYFRLPTEFEWEYVARGGHKGVAKREKLPFEFDQISEYAVVASDGGRKKGRARAIGSRKAVSGVYDIFGNVAEYMAEPYTMDYGFGTVGGRVARGGSYFNTPTTLSVAKRIEVPLFRESQSAMVTVRSPFTGIRLMIGASATGGKGVIQKIEEEHKSGYIALGGGSGGDVAGNSRRKAKKLGEIKPGRAITMADTVGGEDTSDHFMMTTQEFGDFSLEVTSTDGSVVADIQKAGSRKRVSARPGKNGRISLKNLLPGRIFVRFYSSSGSKTVQYSAQAKFLSNDAPGNVAKDAQDLSRLTSSGLSISQWVGSTDKVDYYKFFLPNPDTISLRVIDMTGDVNVELLDENNRIITASKYGGRANEKIEHANAKSGTYYVRVFLAGVRPARYKMLLARGAVDTAGSTQASARDLGTLRNRAVNITEKIGGSDTADYYKVSVSSLSLIKVELGRLEADAQLVVYDRSGKLIFKSDKSGTSAEKIHQGIKPGTYYVAALSKGGKVTPYAMNVDIQAHLPYDDWRLAYPMTVSTSSSNFTGRFRAKAQNQWAKFYLSKEGTLRLDLTSPGGGSSANLNLTVWHQGNRIYSSTGPTANETFSRALKPGQIYVDISNPKGGSVPYKLVARFTPSAGGSSTTTSSTSPSTRMLGTFRDWRVGTANYRDGTKYCFAYTFARSVSPFNWRKNQPRLYFSVDYRKNNLVTHYFDITSVYDTSYPVGATVTVRGRAQRIPAVRVNNRARDFRSLERCGKNRKDWCVSNRGMRAFTRGSAVTFTGVTKDGRRAQVNYSLYGFQKAITRMNRECRVRNSLVRR